jgi:hypothetical protein
VGHHETIGGPAIVQAGAKYIARDMPAIAAPGSGNPSDDSRVVWVTPLGRVGLCLLLVTGAPHGDAA